VPLLNQAPCVGQASSLPFRRGRLEACPTTYNPLYRQLAPLLFTLNDTSFTFWVIFFGRTAG